MENIVTMSLYDYDQMRDKNKYLKERIKEMEIERIEELKEIFKLKHSYSTTGVYIDATNIIKELYGEMVERPGEGDQILVKEKLTAEIYSVWKDKPEEE